MKVTSSKPNKIYRFGKFILCGGLGLVAAAVGLKYISAYQQEKINALSMQAMLVNIIAAEDAYDGRYHRYTDRWEQILSAVARPKTLQVAWAPVPEQPTQYRMGFGKDPGALEHGYVVSLQVNSDGKNGSVKAVRENKRGYQYSLERAFEEGETQCVNQHYSKYFCRWFEKNASALELKNLISVPQKKSEEAEKKEN